MPTKLYAGTSGYSYPSWKPDFYPKEVPSARFLNYYASRLNLVEVNYTFRQIAKELRTTEFDQVPVFTVNKRN